VLARLTKRFYSAKMIANLVRAQIFSADGGRNVAIGDSPTPMEMESYGFVAAIRRNITRISPA
jgi:hypothetical protein